MEKTLAKLYKMGGRGKVLEWQVGFDGEEIWTSAGQVDGKKTIRMAEVILNKTGRNLEEQALLEMKSRFKKKMDEGYSESLNTSESGLMLADKYREDLVSFPCVVQPKIDGIRMSAHLEGGELITLSRRNNSFNFLDDLKDEIKEYLGKSKTKLDGELYSFTLNFDKISGIVRSKKTRNPQEDEVIYMIFDNVDYQKPTQPRLEKLGVPITDWSVDSTNELFFQVSDHIYIVKSWFIHSNEELFEFEEYILSQKLEGVMIRHLQGPLSIYKGSRAQNLLKLKREQDDEGEIVGYTTGSGAERDKVIWKVKDKRGNVIAMRPCGTFEGREELLKNAEKYVGRIITYRFFELNPESGVPRFPRVLRFRDDEPN